MELREQLARNEHEQWMRWANGILPELKELTRHHMPYNNEIEAGNCACKTCQRIKRWEQECIKPYSELSEKQKDADRKEVDQIIALLAKEGYGKMVNCPDFEPGCGEHECEHDYCAAYETEEERFNLIFEPIKEVKNG